MKVSKTAYGGTLVEGSIPYPEPGWNTGSYGTPRSFPVETGDHMNPEKTFFGDGGCAPVYLLTMAMLEVMRHEHEPHLNLKREKAFRAEELEIVTRPGRSKHPVLVWKRYWSLPLEFLRVHDQIRLITACSDLSR